MSVSELQQNDFVSNTLDEIKLGNLQALTSEQKSVLRNLLAEKTAANQMYRDLYLSPADLTKYAAAAMSLGWNAYNMDLPDFISYLSQQGATVKTLTSYAQWAKKLGYLDPVFFKPLQHECRWVEPNAGGIYSSPSVNFSVLALITCVTTGVNMGVLFQAWWTWINSVVKPTYNKYKDESKPERVAHVWDILKKSSQVCYDVSSLNYLASILLYNACQCSCGVHMMLDVMQVVDPTVQVTLFLSPQHVQLVVYDDDGQPYIIETTAQNKNVDKLQVEQYQASGLFPSDVARETLALNTWLRIIFSPDHSPQQIMCYLQTCFRLLPSTSKSLALDIFVCFAGWANANLEAIMTPKDDEETYKQKMKERWNMEKCLEKWSQDSNIPLFMRHTILDYSETLFRFREKHEFTDCTKISAPSTHKKMQKFEKKSKQPDVAEIMTFLKKIAPKTISVGTQRLLRNTLVDQASKLYSEISYADNAIESYEAAFYLVAGMMWENPKIFQSNATAYMKYLDDNKIDPQEFKTKSKWAEDYNIITWDLDTLNAQLSEKQKLLEAASYLEYDAIPIVVFESWKKYRDVLIEMLRERQRRQREEERAAAMRELEAQWQREDEARQLEEQERKVRRQKRQETEEEMNARIKAELEEKIKAFLNQ
jgi:hypothetical protein